MNIRSALPAAIVAALLSGCGLNPQQLGALDGAMCSKIYGTTTTIVGGSSKTNGTRIDGDTCSITTVNEAREPAAAPTRSAGKL